MWRRTRPCGIDTRVLRPQPGHIGVPLFARTLRPSGGELRKNPRDLLAVRQLTREQIIEDRPERVVLCLGRFQHLHQIQEGQLVGIVQAAIVLQITHQLLNA